MPSPENLAKQIDRAISDNFVHDIMQGAMLADADPIDAIVIQALDPNGEELENHIFALLRYPEAPDAVRLLPEVQRGHLLNLLDGSDQFGDVKDALD